MNEFLHKAVIHGVNLGPFDCVQVYPLKSTVLFFGILLSTAVVQLVITGTAVTFVICTLGALPEAFTMLEEVFSFIIAWIAIALVDTFIMQVQLCSGAAAASTLCVDEQHHFC